MVRSLGVLTDAVPFSADDLPGYAGALFDHMIAHPAMVRLTMWKLLETAECLAGGDGGVPAEGGGDRRGPGGRPSWPRGTIRWT